ncbi:MAG: hypothetical protein RIC35_13830 [Marinoscillum sp.]
MKTIALLKANLLMVLVLISYCTIARGPVGEKRKEIEKSFPVTASTELEITNQFGEVHVDTWEKNEVKVKIEIIANGKSDDRAQKLLDRISIDIREGNIISFDTRISGNTNTKGEESFEINYQISYPSRNKLSVDNQFGDTYIGGRSGPTDLEVSYGNLKTADFTGFVNLELSFSKGNVGNLKNAEVEVKYSGLDIESAEELEMEQQFSDIRIKQVRKLDLESKYGDVKIGEVSVLKVDAEFSGFGIEKLNDKLFMEASYVSNFKIEDLNRDFSKVEIYGKFSTYTIELQDGTNAELEATFSFANMSSSNNQVDVYYKVKDDNRSEYKAKIGGGDPNRKIIVKSSYGDLKIR